jgi:tRNA pseudouridine38-40 synthase
MRYWIHLAFDGAEYRGWQRQKTPRNTVQEVIENCLSQIFKKPISVYGCGRTDAGVHASQYVVQINLDTEFTFDLAYRLNKNLPSDIAVYDVVKVNADQHVRYDAIARTYDYFIHWKKDPVLMNYSAFYDDLDDLDFELMQEACVLLRNTKDFLAVCKQPDLYPNTLCEVSNCALYVDEAQSRLRFTITANRFLRGMVRICVFFLLKVGNKEMTLEELSNILSLKTELNEKIPAFPNGLFLSRVEYPYLTFDNQHQLITMLKVGLQ